MRNVCPTTNSTTIIVQIRPVLEIIRADINIPDHPSTKSSPSDVRFCKSVASSEFKMTSHVTSVMSDIYNAISQQKCIFDIFSRMIFDSSEV